MLYSFSSDCIKIGSMNVKSWDKCLTFGFDFSISHSLLFTGFILALFFWKICLSVWSQALPSTLRSLVEVKHESMHMHISMYTHTHVCTHARTVGFQTSPSIYCFIKLSHEPKSRTWEYRKKEKPILLRWFDVICGLQNARLYCVHREKEREQEKKRSWLRNSEFQLAYVIWTCRLW